VTVDLDELERLARMATEGPWIVVDADNRGDRATVFHLNSEGLVLCADRPSYEFHGEPENDAKYLAACSPETLLALVAIARATKAYVEANDAYNAAFENEVSVAEVRHARIIMNLEGAALRESLKSLG
jgi:hypothetical protein